MTHSHSSVLIMKPSKAIDATITVPGSKSITNRMLIAAALADGESTISNASTSDDTTLLIHALNNLGANIRCIKNDCSPIDIVSNGLRGGNINIKGDISSQFISSLLLIAP